MGIFSIMMDTLASPFLSLLVKAPCYYQRTCLLWNVPNRCSWNIPPSLQSSNKRKLDRMKRKYSNAIIWYLPRVSECVIQITCCSCIMESGSWEQLGAVHSWPIMVWRHHVLFLRELIILILPGQTADIVCQKLWLALLRSFPVS